MSDQTEKSPSSRSPSSPPTRPPDPVRLRRGSSAAFDSDYASSKYVPIEGFADLRSGHIVLQDHGDDVWFRNIKIRDLSAPPANTVKLFNGKNLDGWAAFLPDGAKRAGPGA